MTEQQQSPEGESEHPWASEFSQVASGVYRVFDVELVWKAFQYAIDQQLFAKNPTIMLMFVRIAEVYPELQGFLSGKLNDAPEPQRQAINLLLNPPQEIRNAQYLPQAINSPGEMDLCWAEFLVTGETESVQMILDVLDRDDRAREFLASQLSSGELELSDEQRMTLQQVGIGIGKLTDEIGWEVMTPGDVDLFLSLGIKDQNLACQTVFSAMNDDLKLHVACKGAALWSLRANASTHGKIRLFCDQASTQPGGFGRGLLVAPS